MKLRSLRLGSVVAVLGLSLPLLFSPAASAAPGREPPALTSVTARHVGDVDRVTFGFSDDLPAHVHLHWADGVRGDGSGQLARVAGAQVLVVTFAYARAYDYDQDRATVRSRKAFALPNVITSVLADDFEGYVTVGLGVQERTSYTVTKLHDPDRVVVDVRADFPTTTSNIWLVDTHAVATGTGPFFVPRPRLVRSDAPAAASLRALFAGPTRQERAAGLGLARSRVWGFDDLAIADRIARLRLTRHGGPSRGGCSTKGLPVTVVGEIDPTLRQFPSVTWVKIAAPGGGGTEQPTGEMDSIPECLEP